MTWNPLTSVMIPFPATPAPGLSNPRNVGGTIVPDVFATEKMVGHRYWHVTNAGDGSGLALRSLHLDHIWWNADQTASCPTYGHRAPDPQCACGFYAELPDHPLPEWMAQRYGRVSASADIEMWGRIIQCEAGFKAEHVEVVGLMTLDVTCQFTCEQPVKWVFIPDQAHGVYPAYCEEHAFWQPESVRVAVAPWLREAGRQLSARYGVEVLSWADLEGA